MMEEMSVIEENRTWELVNLPVGCRSIGLKWVYKVKRDERGAVVRCGTRHGSSLEDLCSKKESIFEEVFTPVVRMESMLLMSALTTTRGWNVHH